MNYFRLTLNNMCKLQIVLVIVLGHHVYGALVLLQTSSQLARQRF